MAPRGSLALAGVLHGDEHDVVGDQRPAASAPNGTVRNCLTSPRSGPATGTRKRPSFEPSALPSVEIHRLPTASNATLSGQVIGLTFALSKPPK